MERLNRRDLFKVALGTVGAVVVGKVAPAHAMPTLQIARQDYPLYTLDVANTVLPIRADEVWSASMNGIGRCAASLTADMLRHDRPLSAKYVYGGAFTDEGMPSIRSSMDSNTFGWTKHTAGPDGEVITNDRQPDITLNGQPYWLMHDIDEWGDGWEEGEGFDA